MEKDSKTPSCWAVVPAAGHGSRMGADIPKQYLPLAGAPVLERTLFALAACGRLRGIVVALAADDPLWPRLKLPASPPIYPAQGGEERSRSVLNALLHLQSFADPEDFVLVHDAARPCLGVADI